MQDLLLHSFKNQESLSEINLPEAFPDPYSPSSEPLAHLAAKELLELLESHDDIFSLLGLQEGQGSLNVGKMWGVLVVSTPKGNLGHLWAVSGKLNEKVPKFFVPTIIDHLNPESKFKAIENELLDITAKIQTLQSLETSTSNKQEISSLKQKRKELSQATQESIFDEYQMLSYSATAVNIRECYQDEAYSQPLSGSGDCSAPKLLQYAFQKGYEPISLAEFWWGPSPKASIRHSGRFYGACKGKCRPILKFMLDGLPVAGEAVLSRNGEFGSHEVIYEDNHILVVNKAFNILSVPGRQQQDNVQDKLQQEFSSDQIKMVHRLDMATTGILIAAKDPESFKDLQKQFQTKEVEKVYYAQLERPIPSSSPFYQMSSGEIQLPIGLDWINRPQQQVNADGKASHTKFEIIQDGPKPWVKLFPRTGRTHQLRIHCAHHKGLGAPIVGDVLYGSQVACVPRHDTVQLPTPPLQLQAAEVKFKHPATREIVELKLKPLYQK